MTTTTAVENPAAIVDELVSIAQKMSAEQIRRLASEASDDPAYDSAYDDELAAEAALGNRAEKMVMPAIDAAYDRSKELGVPWDTSLLSVIKCAVLSRLAVGVIPADRLAAMSGPWDRTFA